MLRRKCVIHQILPIAKRLTNGSMTDRDAGSSPASLPSFPRVYGYPKDSLYSQSEAFESDVRSNTIELVSVTKIEILVTADL